MLNRTLNRPTAVGLTLCALLAGCETPSAPRSAPDTASPSTAPYSTTRRGDAATARDGASANTEAAPAPKQPAGPPLPPAEARRKVLEIIRSSMNLLDAGEEDKARHELDYAKELEPDNKQVNCLLRGITEDPEAELGKESTPYTIRPGETLGAIAQRTMKSRDVCEFYLLARYNNIKVPKQISVGQTIRIPGRGIVQQQVTPVVTKPAPAATTPPAAPVVAKPQPTPPAQSPAPTPEPVAKSKPTSPEPDEQVKRAEVNRLTRGAQEAYARQDLDSAIRQWNAVLAIDPNNNNALVNRQRASDLKRKLDEINSKPQYK